MALKLKIATVDDVSSKFLTQGTYEQGQTISQFHKALVLGSELEPLNLIKSLAGSTDGTRVLIKENASSKGKEWKIPIIVGVIGVCGQFANLVLQSLFK